jgi:formate hydrogenlyase subunit 3/multisubunit Na+/H+ antiporter MnhD subunit
MHEEAEKVKHVNREAPMTMIIGLAILATVVIALSIVPFFFFDFISKIVDSFINIDAYIKAVLG